MFRTNLEYVEIVTHKSIRKMEIEQIILNRMQAELDSLAEIEEQEKMEQTILENRLHPITPHATPSPSNS